MQLKFIVGTIASALWVTSPVIAESYDWVFVARGKEPGEVYHIDVKSIQRHGTQAVFWEMASSIEKLQQNEYKSQVAIDCKTNKFKVLYAVFYDKEGRNSNTFGRAIWYPIVPQSINDLKRRFVCEGYRPKDPLASGGE